ncbi:MAG TPA: prepilin-type N-terminal cleavage/methylation domain-containing protein [Gemmatales bacterium]|nr:prepilin-type N-terminal cleavage/methylation domain-containing protein [Gemmatales bacterium]
MRLSPKRSGFTLVEVLAAIVIGAVLLAAVYSTLEIMLKSIRIGKEAVQSLQVIRGTAIRLQTDIRQNLSLLMTAPSVQQAQASASSSSTGTAAASGSSGSSEASVDPVQFNLGVQGDQNTLTIYGSQTPHYSRLDAESPNSIFSDLRTITYFCDPTQGLMRQEMVNVLGGTNGDTSQQEAIASEVKSMQFQYFDPTNQSWVPQWDGTNNGPPAAIEVTMTVQMPDIPGVPTRQPINHRLVIAIPTFGSPIYPSTTGTTSP